MAGKPESKINEYRIFQLEIILWKLIGSTARQYNHRIQSIVSPILCGIGSFFDHNRNLTILVRFDIIYYYLFTQVMIRIKNPGSFILSDYAVLRLCAFIVDSCIQYEGICLVAVQIGEDQTAAVGSYTSVIKKCIL
ncbi:hypothetical protein SDC9_135902 [bioreactor metagenome]|uniref:Uncharacterized protein n=1 Tax=bioreactor metagenome TaxID=1076179 RepID=A0A645DIF9_9ZZZZ